MKAGGDAPAHERARQRIAEWLEKQGHGAQRLLARAVPGMYGKPHSDQWISDILKRRGDLTLRDLDAVADHMGVPPGELIRKPDRNYLELTMAETKVVQHFRHLPWDAKQHWLGWLNYVFRESSAVKGGVFYAQPRPARSDDHAQAEASRLDSSHPDATSDYRGTIARLKDGLALLESRLPPEAAGARLSEPKRLPDPRNPHRPSLRRTRSGHS